MIEVFSLFNLGSHMVKTNDFNWLGIILFGNICINFGLVVHDIYGCVCRYKKNRKISLGSEKWLDAELFKVTEDCFEELRSRGYRIAVASVTADSVWGTRLQSHFS